MSEGHVVGVAAEKIGVARSTAYKWREDPAFAVRWDDAIATCIDRAESELIRRAIDQSDHLLQFYVEKRRSEIYGNKRDMPMLEKANDQKRIDGCAAEIDTARLLAAVIEGDYEEVDATPTDHA